MRIFDTGLGYSFKYRNQLHWSDRFWMRPPRIQSLRVACFGGAMRENVDVYF